jgi:RNA polymerase sigma factor (sigma-70 family)
MARRDYSRSTSRDRDAISWFLDQAGRVPLLTHEEELLLGRAVQDWIVVRGVESPTPEQRRAIRRGRRAYERMFNANLRLVVNVAKRYLCAVRNLEMSDLIQEGSFGLSRAIEKFDPTRGYKFSTYAYWWIRQGISRAISQQDRSIRLPVNAIDCLNKLRGWVPVFAKDNGRGPTPEECAEFCGVTPHVMRHYLNHVQAPTSLDQRCTSNDDASTLLEMLAGNEDGPMAVLEVADGIERLSLWMSQLTEQQADVLSMRFGLKGQTPCSQADASRQLGCTRQAIQSSEQRSLNKLRRQAYRSAA